MFTKLPSNPIVHLVVIVCCSSSLMEGLDLDQGESMLDLIVFCCTGCIPGLSMAKLTQSKKHLVMDTPIDIVSLLLLLYKNK